MRFNARTYVTSSHAYKNVTPTSFNKCLQIWHLTDEYMRTAPRRRISRKIGLATSKTFVKGKQKGYRR